MECGPQEVKMLRQTLKGIRVVKQGGETKQVGKNKTKQNKRNTEIPRALSILSQP